MLAIVLLLLWRTSNAYAGNPLLPKVGMADPHLHIFNNRAYIYAGRDADSTVRDFTMPDWNIWESEDLIHWKNVRTIYPKDTYMDPASVGCYASDAAYRNGYCYFYFSNHSNKGDDTGVLRATSPDGIYEDILGKPLLPNYLTPTREYDPCCFIDDDPHQTPYIVFGWWDSRGTERYFQIAKLNEDMMSLAEKPRPIKITGVEYNLDKPNLHKHGDLYYISMGSLYATSTNVYGPYTYRGQVGSTFGLGLRAHGNFKEWNGQWYHVWCRYVKPPFRYRESLMTYLHYKDNGEMVADEQFLEKHFSAGVGQYDANWDKIEAEWYFRKSELVSKKESLAGGFEMRVLSERSFLFYPNVRNIPANATIGFHVSSVSAGCSIEVRDGSETGAILGTCTVPHTGGWDQFRNLSCSLHNQPGRHSLCLTFKGQAEELVRLDWFKVVGDADKHRMMMGSD